MAQEAAPPFDEKLVDRMAPPPQTPAPEAAPPLAVAMAPPVEAGLASGGAGPRLSWEASPGEGVKEAAPPVDIGELSGDRAAPSEILVSAEAAPPMEGRWSAAPARPAPGLQPFAPPPSAVLASASAAPPMEARWSAGTVPASPGPRNPTPPPTHNVIELLRLVSAEAQDLRAVLRRVRDGEAPMAAFAGYVHTTSAQMEEVLAQVTDLDDCFRHMRNTWELIRSSPIIQDPGADLPAQELMQGLGLLDGYCRQLVYWSATRTVPARLKDWLRSSEPGYAIPFHAVFEDEVPDAEDRQKILNQLAWSPVFLKDVGGIVDPESGLVYRYDTGKSRWEMSLAFLWIAAAVGAGAAAVWGLSSLPPLSAGAVPASLMLGWLAMLAGTIVHWVIGANKRLRGQQGAAAGVLPLGRSLILLNAQIGLVLFRIVVALVGYIGLMFAVSSDEFTTFAFNAFLAGYSLDSVVELFGSSMDQRSAAQHANLKQQMGVR